MATDFTPNYNLDKYTATDKPNLRDQYNAAMDKIDLALLSANTNATEAKSATQGFQDQLDLKATQANLDALGALLPAGQFSAQNTVKAALDAKANSTDLNTLATKTALQDEATARANADTALGNRIAIAENRGKVIVAIGDSYGQGYTPDGNVTGWSTLIATYLSKAGVTVKHGSSGGARIANGSFLTILQNVVSNMTTEEKGKCDKVLIAGGYNDKSSTQADIMSGCENIANYVKTNLPHAKCILSFVGRCVTGLTNSGHTGVSMKEVRNAAQLWYICGTRNGMYVDVTGLHCLRQNNYFSSDYVHPNQNGQNYIACHLLNILYGIENGSYTFNNALQESDSISGYDSWTVTKNKELLINTDEYGFAKNFIFGTAATPDTEFTHPTGVSYNFTPNSRLRIGTIYVSSMCAESIIIPAEFIFHKASRGYFKGNGQLVHSDDGALSIRCGLLNADGSNFLTETIDKIQIVPSYLTFGVYS